MTDIWNCLKCGTINEDIIDATYRRMNESKSWGNSPATEWCNDEMQRRHDYLMKNGYEKPQKCTRCDGVRP